MTGALRSTRNADRVLLRYEMYELENTMVTKTIRELIGELEEFQRTYGNKPVGLFTYDEHDEVVKTNLPIAGLNDENEWYDHTCVMVIPEDAETFGRVTLPELIRQLEHRALLATEDPSVYVARYRAGKIVGPLVPVVCAGTVQDFFVAECGVNVTEEDWSFDPDNDPGRPMDH